MGKRTYICPICHIQVKDLKGHTARMHKGKTTPPKSPPKTKGKTLELKTPAKKETTEPRGYHCIDCGAVVTKGQNPCPNCGAHLDWSSL